MTTLAYIHGTYYVITGLLPIFSMSAFEALTGPKKEHWLVKTLGLLISVIGIVILYSGWQKEFPNETILLAVSSALVLSFVDIYYVLKKRIGKVYLLDAAIELLLIGSWLLLNRSTH